jgi:hypothetical protein
MVVDATGVLTVIQRVVLSASPAVSHEYINGEVADAVRTTPSMLSVAGPPVKVAVIDTLPVMTDWSAGDVILTDAIGVGVGVAVGVTVGDGVVLGVEVGRVKFMVPIIVNGMSL